MKTFPISTHLNAKPWQVSIVPEDRSLPFRKWNHLGTIWAVSAKSAAFRVGKGKYLGQEGGLYRFAENVIGVH